MTDDVVAELDRWLDNSNDSTTAIERRVVLRARDEIVALRQRCALHDDLEFVSKNELTESRDAALEAAARVCIGLVRQFPQCGVAASAIRALKDKGG